MYLVEREIFLETLQGCFDQVLSGEGHSVFINGEAGIGKTSLVKTFTHSISKECKLYRGTCDALFTPSPLAPVYEILLQLRNEAPGEFRDRIILFNSILYEIKKNQCATIIIFEDIHWADEATLDFIKFLSRRVNQIRCLLLLTYRDTEIHTRHPLQNVLGQLIPGSYTKMELPLLSKMAVEKLAAERGRAGKDIYSISGGNPFYVSEILAAYHEEIPGSIRDSILYAYNNCDEKAKKVWDILAVIPSAFEVDYLDEIVPGYAEGVASCIHHKILIVENKFIYFKHDLYRRSIESILSPLEKLKLHRIILNLFLPSFEKRNQIERIVHHAKNGNDYELVTRYAPLAAKQAVKTGAHIEAAKLFLTAIEYYQGNDKNLLIDLYESYAYECYLTNRIKDAIIYTGKALNLAKEKNNIEKTGGNLRFLSRLWWYDGNRKKAESFGQQAIELLKDEQLSPVKAMAFSNMSQLKMLADEPEECIIWGDQAIAMAKELGDYEILSHAMNNVGSVKMMDPLLHEEGIQLLKQSLVIALENGYHEHAARAYTNLQANLVKLKLYAPAKEIMEKGIEYCEERDLLSWLDYMMSWKAILNLETCNWVEASSIADQLLNKADQPAVIKINALIVTGLIKMRQADAEAFTFLAEAKTKSLETRELQRIIPVVFAILEYEWLKDESVFEKQEMEQIVSMLMASNNNIWRNEFKFWMKKAGRNTYLLKQNLETYDRETSAKSSDNKITREKNSSRFLEAMMLFEGNTEEKRNALSIMDEIGASAVCEKMKLEMKESGIKNIPRGIRKSTRSNIAFLTDRELDVLQLLKEELQNKEIASRLFISAKTVDHHISSILFKLDVNSRTKAVAEALRQQILK